jgi:protein-tyrosine-phosphatase
MGFFPRGGTSRGTDSAAKKQRIQNDPTGFVELSHKAAMMHRRRESAVPNARATPVTEPRPYNVLILCTGNSARSVMAEAILNRLGAGKFRAYSAGSQPKGEVHPETLLILSKLGYDVSAIRSKSWSEFAKPGSPQMDFVFTVCDDAAGEACPVWPGAPMTAHWGIPDPAAVRGTPAEIGAAFADAYRYLHNRISIFVNLPVASLDGIRLQAKLHEIGGIEGATGRARAASSPADAAE